MISTSLGFDPSLGPTMPRSSSKSMILPARANPTRSFLCNIEVDPSCDSTTKSIALTNSSSSSESPEVPPGIRSPEAFEGASVIVGSVLIPSIAASSFNCSDCLFHTLRHALPHPR